jgi:hypothetical protein
MQEHLMTLWLLTLQYASFTYTFFRNQWIHIAYPFLEECWALYWNPVPAEIRPYGQFFLGDDNNEMEKCLTVPERTVYLEEWRRGSLKKYVVRYEGETIPRSWTENPFDRIVRSPWIWVGDRETEIDLTRTFDKFLVAGNRITRELVNHYVRVTPRTKLMYIQSGTFKELDFPGDGITIEEYVASGPVQSRRPVYRIEEAVPAPVVGGCNDSVE